MALSFGAYTLLDVSLNDVHWADTILAGWSLVLLAITTVATWLLAQVLPSDIQRYLSFEYFIQEWKRVDNRSILLLMVAVTAFTVYGFLEYGVLSQMDSKTLHDQGYDVSYWFTAIKQFVEGALISVMVAAFIKLPFSTRIGKVVLMTLFVLAAVFLSMYGRRAMIYPLMLITFLWFYKKGRNPFSWAGLSLVCLALPCLLVFSNIYQTYRVSLTAIGIFKLMEQEEEPPTLWEAATDSTVTFKNFEEREALWRFNYLVLSLQSERAVGALPYGDLFIQALLNSVPKVLYEEKSYINVDDATAVFYGIPVLDYGSTLATLMQADWGYASILLTPVFLFLVSLIAGLFIRLSSGHPALLWILSVLTIQFFINVETDYTDLIMIIRNLVMITLGYFVLYTAYRCLRYAGSYIKVSVIEGRCTSAGGMRSP